MGRYSQVVYSQRSFKGGKAKIVCLSATQTCFYKVLFIIMATAFRDREDEIKAKGILDRQDEEGRNGKE